MPLQGIRYIKIAKIDKNGVDQTNTLQSLTEITIPFNTGNITYNVIATTEKPTYFLYSVPYTPVEWADRSELEYDFSSSIVTTNSTYQCGPTSTLLNIPIGFNNIINDNLDFAGTKKYILNTYPQKNTTVEFSGSLLVHYPVALGFNTSVNCAIQLQRSDNTYVSLPSSTRSNNTILNQTSFTSSFHLSMSYGESSSSDIIALPGDKLFVQFDKLQCPGGSSSQFTASFTQDTFFRITSSIATGPQFTTVAEPYFGVNNFSKAIDCQPLFNNANTNRRHNLFMDIDYSAGVTEPTNFDLIISGSALRAEVQTSNYSTLRHILPRYNGSKSTSQKLNTFTKGDTGTYGKSPTVESLKRMVAYCDFIGGWPPERMNASSAHIIYLIDENGDVKIPDTSENSLQDVRGTFQTGERVELNSKTIGSGISTPFRNIIRGGSRIEPVLYTQIGKVPNVLWTSSILLEDIEVTSGSATQNYQNNGSIGITSTIAERDRLKLQTGLTNDNLIFTNGSAPGIPTTNFGYYKTPIGVINENVTLNIQILGLQLDFETSTVIGVNFAQNTSANVGIILKIKTLGIDSTYAVSQQHFPPGSFNDSIFTSQQTITLQDFNFTIPPGTLQENSEISIEYKIDTLVMAGFVLLEADVKGGSYSITQTPVPTLPITVGNNDIWGYFNKATNPSVITSSDAVSESLGAFYGDPNVKQTNILNSGFNNLVLPWSLKTGDEFRFEGEEKNTYMVTKAYGPNDNSSNRLSQTGSIEVHFDKNLPISASISSFNLDHFAIRRYVDDASSIIIEGFKPTGSSGPFILTPEYSVDKLSKNIDEYITILTEKNLLL